MSMATAPPHRFPPYGLPVPVVSGSAASMWVDTGYCYVAKRVTILVTSFTVGFASGVAYTDEGQVRRPVPEPMKAGGR